MQKEIESNSIAGNQLKEDQSLAKIKQLTNEQRLDNLNLRKTKGLFSTT